MLGPCRIHVIAKGWLERIRPTRIGERDQQNCDQPQYAHLASSLKPESSDGINVSPRPNREWDLQPRSLLTAPKLGGSHAQTLPKDGRHMRLARKATLRGDFD